MANETKNAPTQLDIEMNNIDRAVRALRDFQKGAATTSFVRSQLRAVKPTDLRAISIATRISLPALEELRQD